MLNICKLFLQDFAKFVKLGSNSVKFEKSDHCVVKIMKDLPNFDRKLINLANADQMLLNFDEKMSLVATFLRK